MKFKNKKLNYKMLNSFLFTLSVVLFLISYMFVEPANYWVVFSGIIINSIILILRIMLQSVKRKSVLFEIVAIVISIYMFCFKNEYQAYWIGFIVAFFSYVNHSNFFMKRGFNETFTKICACKYRRYATSDTEFVDVSEIKAGDFLQLFSGETIPCDGVVKAGSGTVNAMNVTGDSKILNINKGDKVFSGYIVLSGKLIVETTAAVSDSSLSRTMKILLDIGKERAPKEKKIFRINLIASLSIFAVLFIIFLLVGLVTKNYELIRYAVPMILIVSFEIAGTDIISDVYEATAVNLASKGIVVKNKWFIEKNFKPENIGFSVKGVLSGKKPLISKVESVFNITEEELIKVAAYALYRTGSSMAKVITNQNTSDINIADIRDFKPVGNYGGYVKICGDVEVVAGSVEDLNSFGIIVGYENSDDTIYIGIDGKFAGFIQFETPLNEDIFQCMNNLRFAGVKNIFVYSHCNNEVAKQILKMGNLTDVYGNLNDKQIKDRLKKLKGNTIMFRYGATSADYSEYVSEIGYGGYDVFDRYEAVILTDNLLPAVNFVNVLKDAKNLVFINSSIAVITRILILLMFVLKLKLIWIPVMVLGISMSVMHINNLKFRYKI